MTDRRPDDSSQDAESDADRSDAARDERRRLRREERRRRLAESVVLSPCVAICQLDEAGRTCIGCARTVDEIRDWMIMEDAEKRAVLARIEAAKRAPRDSGPDGR